MRVIRRYEEQVYAGVLGKVIGVYMGSPVEGWTADAIAQRLGAVDRYVHDELGRALIRPDDDISGTLTFVRALEDSGRYADTPPAFFGDTWLNYLIEHQTVLWWGGMGVSTEHTAYLRLRQGIQPPRSGSADLNGRVVAEQIGAQIFIDAFGMVAPGDPGRAAELARRAAQVSHDGEAVHAARVVAAMVSASFVEKNMRRLLDIGVSVIPPDSRIARVHRDVRAWCRQDRDWRTTYRRIARRYGYDRYGGGCHVVPNHALLVLAWSCAPDDFYQAQVIVNSAGWDTDCNAANVGSLMGIKVGLAGINRRFDFRGPVADRILLPTAEGCRLCTDALTEALRIARIGRRLMGWPALPPPKCAAWHHFEIPGSRHGWAPEDRTLSTRGAAEVDNVAGHSRAGSRSLCIRYRGLTAGRWARVSTPIFPSDSTQPAGYAIPGTPRLYSGQRVQAAGVAGATPRPPVELRVFARVLDSESREPERLVHGRPVRLRPATAFTASLEIPDTGGWPVADLGLEIRGSGGATGEIFLDSVRKQGRPQLARFDHVPLTADHRPVGWITDADAVRCLRHGEHAFTTVRRNEGCAVLVTGADDWTDYTFEGEMQVHLAEQAGLLVRYQGLRRYMALVQTRTHLRLALTWYGQSVLAEVRRRWVVDRPQVLRLTCKGRRVTAACDGRVLLQAEDRRLGHGGAGFLVDTGTASFRSARLI